MAKYKRDGSPMCAACTDRAIVFYGNDKFMPDYLCSLHYKMARDGREVDVREAIRRRGGRG